MADYSEKTKDELIRELKLANSRISNYEKYTKERAEKNAHLREQAELMLSQYKIEQKGQEGFKQLLEELNVYKFELEIQNEQLRMTSDEILKERKKYKELYDKAPIPYITIDKTGHIYDVNLEGKRFPGFNKINYQSSIYDFVYEESRFKLSMLMNDAFESNTTQDAQINFIFDFDQFIWAKVNATAYYDNDHNKKMIRLAITDISKEQQRSAEEIKKRDERLEKILNNINDAVFLHPKDLNKPFKYFNETAVRRYGYSKEEFLKISPNEFSGQPQNINPQDYKDLLSNKKQKLVFETFQNTKDGRKIPVEVSASSVELDDREYFLSVVRDITNRKEAESQIKKLNHRIESSMQAGGMAWWEMELPSGGVYFSKVKTDLLGYEKEHVKHYNDFTELIHPDDYEETMQQMRDHLQGKTETYQSEYRIRRKDGEYIWFRDVGRISQKQDNYFKLTGITNNVTKRKEAERKIKESEEKFRVISEFANEGIILIDNEGSVTYANPAVENIFGYKQEEIIGENIHEKLAADIFNEEHLQKFKIWQKTGTGDAIDLKTYYDISTKAGSKKTIEVSISSIDHKNGWNAVGIISDVTKEKEAAKRLKELNASKDKMFSIISHDLRSPFSGFLSLTEFLKDEVDTISKDDLKQISEAILKSANSLYDLLEDLLRWSQSQRGKTPFKPEKINLNELVFDNISLMTKTAMDKKIKIINKCDEKMPAVFDRNMINTVIRNLLSNAVKFSYPNSDIIFECSKSKHFTTVSVIDSGKGMTKEVKEKIFTVNDEKVQRGTINEKGTGLGLVICKEFIEKHGGEIIVKSEPEKGSKFTFSLPNKK